MNDVLWDQDKTIILTFSNMAVARKCYNNRNETLFRAIKNVKGVGKKTKSLHNIYLTFDTVEHAIKAFNQNLFPYGVAQIIFHDRCELRKQHKFVRKLKDSENDYYFCKECGSIKRGDNLALSCTGKVKIEFRGK